VPDRDRVIGIEGWVGYDWHGHWVEHDGSGAVGRIGYVDGRIDEVVVTWFGGVPEGMQADRDHSSFAWVPMSELTFLERKPEPWYDFGAIERRLTAPGET